MQGLGLTDLTGGKLGCWNIVEQSGSMRYWNCKCSICGNKFRKSYTSLVSKKHKPVFCGACYPKIKEDNNIKVHWSLFNCNSRSIYNPQLTDNKYDVTCVTCLNMMGRL